jgi:hypothetical protein
MAKGQSRSKREAKKPKQSKPQRAAVTTLAPPGPPARDGAAAGGRGRPGARNGRK